MQQFATGRFFHRFPLVATSRHMRLIERCPKIGYHESSNGIQSAGKDLLGSYMKGWASGGENQFTLQCQRFS